jgi:hypothetical protein
MWAPHFLLSHFTPLLSNNINRNLAARRGKKRAKTKIKPRSFLNKMNNWLLITRVHYVLKSSNLLCIHLYIFVLGLIIWSNFSKCHHSPHFCISFIYYSILILKLLLCKYILISGDQKKMIHNVTLIQLTVWPLKAPWRLLVCYCSYSLPFMVFYKNLWRLTDFPWWLQII